MKKQDKLDMIQSAIETPKLCRCYFTYDENYFYYYPNAVNEKFLLGQEENDAPAHKDVANHGKDFVLFQINGGQRHSYGGQSPLHQKQTPANFREGR